MASLPQAQAEPTGTSFEIPVRLVSSHSIANPGFQSKRKGEFVSNGKPISSQPFHAEKIEVLGVNLNSLTLSQSTQGRYLLHLEFENPYTVSDAQDYIVRLTDTFTVSLASSQKDAWYGNLLLEAGVSGLRDVSPKPENTIHVEGSVGLTSEEIIQIDDKKFTSLEWSPLTAIFAEGMRAPQPKAKFLFWFVILEELEAREEFKSMFTPLFSDAEKTQLMAANLTAEGKQRVSQLLSNVAATKEGRPQKLLNILQKIGLHQVQGLRGPIVIDEKICRSLIKQRNNIAHKGASINKDELYTILFPLAQGALAYISKN